MSFRTCSNVAGISNIDCAAQITPSNQRISNRLGIIKGADQTEKYVPYLKGTRIGLVANQSSLIGKKSIVDSLLSLCINIVKVFGPEHGLEAMRVTEQWWAMRQMLKPTSQLSLYLVKTRNPIKTSWRILT